MHHGLGSIAIANGNFSDTIVTRKPVPRDKKVAWSSITSNQGIPTKVYVLPKTAALKQTILKPVKPEKFQRCFVNLLWACAHLFPERCSSWAGYMSTLNNAKPLSKSIITMLPIINLPATDMTALHSLLFFVNEQSKKQSLPMPTITFDQPLYLKAYEIVSTKKMDLFVRLGGFHQLMSFLGSIGSLMEGSGLRSAMETVYAPLTVGHMFTGKAYSRAVRGHMLAASAVLTIMLEEFWDELNSDQKAQLIEVFKSEDPLARAHENISMKLTSWFEERNINLKAESRTSTLWLNYTAYVELTQQFIKAERTNNWLLHVATTRQMINLFAATGHDNYAKTCRLYLQSVLALEKEHPDVFAQFMIGNHTVRRTEKVWSGIWTDLSIEQILMKSLKGRGGVIGKGMSENVANVWTKTMHRCAEFSDAMEELTSVDRSTDKHKEVMPGRVQRDYEDFEKILAWFKVHNPFLCGKKLVSLDSGLIDERAVLTCDKAEEVGSKIQNTLDGQAFADCSFKRKDKITNLQSLYSSVTIDKEQVSIDPLTLFLRLTLAVGRKPDTEIENYFFYELTPYPTSLFDNGSMRVAKNKVSLKKTSSCISNTN